MKNNGESILGFAIRTGSFKNFWVMKFRTQSQGEVARTELALEIILENPHIVAHQPAGYYDQMREAAGQVVSEKLKEENLKAYCPIDTEKECNEDDCSDCEIYLRDRGLI